MAMSIQEIRKLTGLSIVNFAYKYHIPYRTVENWEAKSEKQRRECPIYVRELLERAVREDFPTDEKKEQ